MPTSNIERGRLITLFQGVEASMPTLEVGQPAYTTDTRSIWVGTSLGNRRVLMEGDASINGNSITDNSISFYKLDVNLQNKINDMITLENIPLVTTTNKGAMSPSDKVKLDGIENGATKNIVVDNLLSYSTTSSLSANQGRILRDMIGSGGGGTIVIDNLTSTSTGSALSANMGRELKHMIDNITNSGGTTNIIDNLSSSSTTSALSANQGRELKLLIDSMGGSGGVVVVNNLTTASITNALSANMGKVINDNFISLQQQFAILEARVTTLENEVNG